MAGHGAGAVAAYRVIDWAKNAVAANPQHNVIVVTHDYIDGTGGIEQSRRLRCDQPAVPVRQPDQQYANVKMAFSGHIGYAASGTHRRQREQDLHVPHHVPPQDHQPGATVTVDTTAGTLKTWIYAPHNNQTFSEYSKTITGVDFVG